MVTAGIGSSVSNGQQRRTALLWQDVERLGVRPAYERLGQLGRAGETMRLTPMQILGLDID